MLRARFDLATAYSAGLAAHASVLHDLNLTLLRRAREGYVLGARTVNRLHEPLEDVQRDNTRLEDTVARLRDRAGQADALETRCRVQNQAETEHIHQLQDELTAARAESSALSARLALVTAPPPTSTASSVASRDLQDELTRAHADVASLQAALSAVNAELATSVAACAQASDETASLGWERDSLADQLRATQSDLAQGQCAAEAEARLHAFLEEDVRRVNALLVAQAEESQRDHTRIHDLEASLSSASAARVVVEADAARTRRGERQAVGRAQRFHVALLESRTDAARRRDASGARLCAGSTHRGARRAPRTSAA
ncbi:unnamed protein product [Phytophthora fragariaefolia]|uniref:Unnamed protein product n=1 Tax=Phytophthora fragariaefolia TaxID=1490495 RepID=A0A9W6WJG3_9STRA|nr:unnamed protein product [Phytophthora fragariaefolia]